jgi:hypothetical protein
MKRPLAAVVSCYAVGLLLAGFFQPPLAALFGTAFAVLVLAVVLEKFRPFLIWPLLALAGWTNLASRTAVVSSCDLRALIGNEAAIVAVRGALIETPHLKIVERGEQETEHSLARVRVAGLRRGENWQPASGSIMVTTPTRFPMLFSPASRLKFPASSPVRPRRWPTGFSITAIISRRAAFITSLKRAPPTTGNCARRFYPRRR